jgi:hypothetical protein
MNIPDDIRKRIMDVAKLLNGPASSVVMQLLQYLNRDENPREVAAAMDRRCVADKDAVITEWLTQKLAKRQHSDAATPAVESSGR